MMKIIPGILAFLLLAGCATTAKFEKRMNAKKGMTKSELIEDMGIPDKQYKADDYEIIEYNQSNTGSVPVVNIGTIGNQTYTTQTMTSRTTSCKLEFKIINNIVTNYRYKGDMCISQ